MKQNNSREGKAALLNDIASGRTPVTTATAPDVIFVELTHSEATGLTTDQDGTVIANPRQHIEEIAQPYKAANTIVWEEIRRA